MVEVLDEDDEVIHLVDKAIAVGTVKGIIDWDRRFDHMQQHTGQHVLSAVFHSRFALPTISFHLGSDICTIDVRGREPTQEILDSAMAAANEVVYADRAVSVKYGSAEGWPCGTDWRVPGRGSIWKFCAGGRGTYTANWPDRDDWCAAFEDRQD